eukprot:766680-Hanusia_phi.AAC.5
MDSMKEIWPQLEADSAEKNKLSEQCKYLETELSKVLQMLSHKDDLYTESKAVQEELLDALRDVKARAASTEEEVDRLRLVDETHQRCSQEMRSKLIQEYEGEKSKLVETVSDLNLELSSARAEVEALKSALDHGRNMEAEISSATMGRLKGEYESELRRLRGEIDSLKQSVDHAALEIQRRDAKIQEISSMDRLSFASKAPVHRQTQLPLPDVQNFLDHFDHANESRQDLDPSLRHRHDVSMSSTTNSSAISASNRSKDHHYQEMSRFSHASSTMRDLADSLQATSRDMSGMQATAVNLSSHYPSPHLNFDAFHHPTGRQAHTRHAREDPSSSLHHSDFDNAGDQTPLYSRASATRGGNVNKDGPSYGVDELDETPRYGAEVIRSSLQDWQSMGSANSPPPLKHQPSKPFLPSPPPQLTPKRSIRDPTDQHRHTEPGGRSFHMGGQTFDHADSLVASSDQTILFEHSNASRISSRAPPTRFAQSEVLRSRDPLTPGANVGASASISHKFISRMRRFEAKDVGCDKITRDVERLAQRLRDRLAVTERGV